MNNNSEETLDIEILIGQYGTEILRLCYLYLKDYQLAEDACQETFIRVYNKRHTFKGKSSIKTWIISICINVCRNDLRNNWFRKVILNPPKYMEEMKQFTEEETKHDSDLMDCIKALKPKYREVILLYYYQELSVKEISNMLGMSEASIYKRLSRAKKDMREKGIGEYIHG